MGEWIARSKEKRPERDYVAVLMIFDTHVRTISGFYACDDRWFVYGADHKPNRQLKELPSHWMETPKRPERR